MACHRIFLESQEMARAGRECGQTRRRVRRLNAIHTFPVNPKCCARGPREAAGSRTAENSEGASRSWEYLYIQ
jgi:hypothetical protein